MTSLLAVCYTFMLIAGIIYLGTYGLRNKLPPLWFGFCCLALPLVVMHVVANLPPPPAGPTPFGAVLKTVRQSHVEYAEQNPIPLYVFTAGFILLVSILLIKFAITIDWRVAYKGVILGFRKFASDVAKTASSPKELIDDLVDAILLIMDTLLLSFMLMLIPVAVYAIVIMLVATQLDSIFHRLRNWRWK